MCGIEYFKMPMSCRQHCLWHEVLDLRSLTKTTEIDTLGRLKTIKTTAIIY